MVTPKLLVDFPAGYALSPSRMGDYASYSEALRNCILESERIIRIGVPFIDNAGASMIINCLKDSKNKPETQLIVRTIKDISQESIDELTRLGVNIFIMNEEQERWGFHAKYEIFDDSLVIIGSQNLVERNMKRSLETGVLLGTDIARSIMHIHLKLLSVSTKIN